MKSFSHSKALFGPTILVVFVLTLFYATPSLAAQPSNIKSPHSENIDNGRLAGAFTDCSTVTEIPQAECQALVGIYLNTRPLPDPLWMAPGWTNRTNWLQTDTPCDWFGVGCSGGHVTTLDLSANGLSGSFPAQVSNLVNLQVLHLDNNEWLGNAVPVNMLNLPNLVEFWFDGTRICEPLGMSPWFETISAGHRTNLECPFSCSQALDVPPAECQVLVDLYNSTWGWYQPNPMEATYGWLNGTNWLQTGYVCSWYGVTCSNNPRHVTGLALNSNRLVGSIPDSLGNLTSLISIDLSGNNLNGNNPQTLGNLLNLQQLRIDNNPDLSGNIPIKMTTLPGLVEVWFDGTNLCEPLGMEPWFAVVSAGHRTNRACSFSCRESLDIPQAECQVLVDIFYGTRGIFIMPPPQDDIPPEPPQEPGGWLNKSNWWQTGYVCSWYGVTCSSGSPRHVTGIALNANRLIGWIPPSIGVLTSLNYLDLSGNQIKGFLPQPVIYMSSLQHLRINNNLELSGSLPFDMNQLTNLAGFWFDNTSICEPSILNSWLNIVSTGHRSNIGCTPAPVVGKNNRISLTRSGAQANSISFAHSVSADGRFISFISLAANLVEGDTNGKGDVFVRDLLSGEVTRISLTSSFQQVSYCPNSPADYMCVYSTTISGDGRYVAFTTRFQLVADDNDENTDIYIHDRQTGQKFRVSPYLAGTLLTGNLDPEISISGNGRYIAYRRNNIFVYDRETNQNSLISVGAGGTRTNGYSYEPSISADGRYVVFTSDDINLVEGDTNGTRDVFVRDRNIGQTFRIASDVKPVSPKISNDGRYIAYSTPGTIVNPCGPSEFPCPIPPPASDLYIYDRQTAQATAVRQRPVCNYQGCVGTPQISMSGDGRLIAFGAKSAKCGETYCIEFDMPMPPYELWGGCDTGWCHDIFLFDQATGRTSIISVTPDGNAGNWWSFDPVISTNGSVVIFASNASDLISGDTNSTTDIFIEKFPIVTGINPTNAPSGISDFNLTLTGTNFSSGAVVGWSGKPDLAPTSVSPTQIVVQVPGSYLASPGTAKVLVSTNAFFGGVSNLVPFSIVSLPICATVTGISQAECEALKAIYDSANGPNWSNKAGWLQTPTPCAWYGVGCANGHVASLVLNNNHLVGTIPASLGSSLTNLLTLNLSSNTLSGSIPTTLGSLPNLQQLNLSYNQFSGAIPGQLGGLANLQTLNLYSNQLSGSIPSQLSALANLQYLELGRNQLTGTIPVQLGSLQKLVALGLGSNQLEGPVPTWIGSLPQLEWLNLAENKFSGPIPSQLGSLANLKGVTLVNNVLDGTIPASLGNLSQLQELWLDGNRLSGSLPVELGNLTQLTRLSASSNQLIGTIPTQLGSLTQLKDLILDNNQLSGTLPVQIGSLTLLRTLDLSRNTALRGPLPSQMTTFSSMTRLGFDSTAICVPDGFQAWMGGITNLKTSGLMCNLDQDGDGVPNGSDNTVTVFNPDQRDIDNDGLPDVSDPCPASATNTCNTQNSIAKSFNATGGVLITPSATVTMTIPPNALTTDRSISITDTGYGTTLTTNLGDGRAVFGVEIGPQGTTFTQPVTLVFKWNDTNNDGFVDETGQPEAELYVSKDGVAITSPCASDPGCSAPNNTFTFQVSSFSKFALITPPGRINAPLEPMKVNSVFQASLTFFDSKPQHSFTWDWGDGTTQPSTQTGTIVSATHTYTIAGVYTVKVTIDQVSGGPLSVYFRYLVAYDPEEGFVTGGGWINSPTGAYTTNPSLTGKANFGFTSRYQKGAKVPTGNTEFQFRVGNLNFHSTSYDWLVVAGSKAQYKGTGVINNNGEYGFMLTAIDGKINGGTSLDRFRIKIWEKATGRIIYDNQMNAADDSEPTSSLGGGSITIHNTK